MIPALQGYYLDTVQVNVGVRDGVFNDLPNRVELTPSGLARAATSKDVIPATIEDATASSGDFSYLWTPHTNFSSRPPIWDILAVERSMPWFASAVPTTTDTGVLRVYSLGMGSSFSCAPISANYFRLRVQDLILFRQTTRILGRFSPPYLEITVNWG